jgi:hypothetical protein
MDFHSTQPIIFLSHIIPNILPATVVFSQNLFNFSLRCILYFHASGVLLANNILIYNGKPVNSTKFIKKDGKAKQELE